MASYADITAKNGPKQTDEEKMPDYVPEIAHEDSSVHSLNSQGSINHPNPVPSYAEQQKQAEQNARQAQEQVARTAGAAAGEAEEFGKKAEKKAAELERDAKKTYNDLEKDGKKAYRDIKSEANKDYQKVKAEASKDYEKVKEQASIEAEKAKKNAKKAERWAQDNKDNPVVIGNAIAVTAVAGLVGIGAYRKYVAGELTWKVAGTWAGVVGLFALGDYYVSSWLFKNKYPPKN